MGLSKSELFSERQNLLSEWARVLSHPARIAILEELAKTKACVNTSLVDQLGLAQATISQHLKVLKDSGLIQGSIEGKRMCYCIDPKIWKKMRQDLSEVLNAFSSHDQCC